MMSEEAFSETHNDGSSPEEQWSNNNHTRRKERLPGARTSRSSARLYSASLDVNRKPALAKKERDEHQQQQQQCSKIITQLVDSTPPSPSQLPRWNLRSMWELASLLNFLHTFRPLLNISHEFSVEELETALITPNSTLDDIHIPLLKAIPPVTRMALGRATWVTVLCRKLRDWWHWVADGEIPIVASHGTEVEVYKSLDPGIRVVILKALCDIRVEQEDIRNFIDDSLKQGVQLSAFRKERMGGDSHGISYWYENDPIIGHRLYREIRKVEVKKVKAKRIPVLPTVTCQWETVATNLDEFMEVSEKLFSSKNRTEAAVGKKLKIDMLPEIEKIHKRREKLLKKQHRQALLIDNFLSTNGISSGRSLRDRKPVTYTFDDYDRSISEAIKITKRKQSSPEPLVRREGTARPEASTNGSPSQAHQQVSSDALSPRSTDYEETDEENSSGPLDRSNRRRQRPRRYSEKEFVEAVSDNEADFDSDDDIVGEAVYDDEYLRSRKQRKVSSSSEGDEEYRWDEESGEDEEEEEEDDEDDSLSSSEEPRAHRTKKLPSRRSKTGTRSRSVDESGLRRSKRKSRTHINYRQLEVSESETESTKPEKSKESSPGDSNASNETEYSMGSQDEPETGVEEEPVQVFNETTEKEQDQPPENTNTPGEEEIDGVLNRRFLDLNELAPSTSFDDSPIIKADDMDDF